MMNMDQAYVVTTESFLLFCNLKQSKKIYWNMMSCLFPKWWWDNEKTVIIFFTPYITRRILK
jgi:hypothetical protein